ncbi:MAG: hypothetical protein RR328_03140 [Bacteroidales bacterium]
MEVPVIIIGKGLEKLPLGIKPEDCIKLIGEPDEQEILSLDDEEETLMFEYPSLGYSLFFEGNEQENRKLNSMEVYHEDTLLFGSKIFELNALQIDELMKANHYTDLVKEEEDWGEVVYSYANETIDFIFEDEELVSIHLCIEG